LVKAFKSYIIANRQTHRQTDRQTDVTENITKPYLWVVIITSYLLMCIRVSKS